MIRERALRKREKLAAALPITGELLRGTLLERVVRHYRCRACYPGYSRNHGGKTPRSRDVSIFLRQLALLLAAGLTLDTALQTLSDNTGKALAGFANGLRASISEGDSFAEALEHHTSVIEPAYVAMVRAGEASGKLDAVLRAIVEDRSRREILADRINSAIRYPLFLVGSAILILLFFLIMSCRNLSLCSRILVAALTPARLSLSHAHPGCASIWISFSGSACFRSLVPANVEQTRMA